jgi:microcystin-dependent protein
MLTPISSYSLGQTIPVVTIAFTDTVPTGALTINGYAVETDEAVLFSANTPPQIFIKTASGAWTPDVLLSAFPAYQQFIATKSSIVNQLYSRQPSNTIALAPAYSITSIGANHTLSVNDEQVIQANATLTLTLPAITGFPVGKAYTVFNNTTAGTVTVDPTTGWCDGNTTPFTIPNLGAITFYTDGIDVSWLGVKIANLIPSPTANNIVTTDIHGQSVDSGKAFSTDVTLAGDSDDLSPTQKAVKTYVDTLLQSLYPVGKIDYFPETANFGKYLILNNQAVSRTTYAALFAKWGTTYGAGDGTTTFNVPDMRDKVLGMAGTLHAVTTSAGAETSNAIVNHIHVITHDHPVATSGAGTAHSHPMPHTHAINHDHPAVTSGAGSAHTHDFVSSGASVRLAATGTDASLDFGGTSGVPGQINTTTGMILAGPTPENESAHTHSVNLAAFTGTSGAVSTANTSTEAAHTHTVDIANFVGNSGSTGTGTEFSLLQPTYFIGAYFVYAGV